VVVRTVPEAGKDGIDASLTEIKVTYSKDMADGTWSWSTAGKENFPEIPEGAKPHYLNDKRTCVLPVKLKPHKAYAIWLNSGKFGNFKDADGRSAVPYLLVFKTK
jgi:RNA polymerase sigma-70 factor (ECF subfamily)